MWCYGDSLTSYHEFLCYIFCPMHWQGQVLSANAGTVKICHHNWLKISLHNSITTKWVLAYMNKEVSYKNAFVYSFWIENTIFIKKGCPFVIGGRHKAITELQNEAVNVWVLYTPPHIPTDSMKSPWRLCGDSMDFRKTTFNISNSPHGLHGESMRTPCGLCI